MSAKNEVQEYRELDLMKLILTVLAKWWLIVLLVILAGGATVYLTANYVTPIYRAESTLFIGKETDVLSSISISDFNLDNKLVVDYRELIKTRLVTDEVIEALTLQTTRYNLVKNLNIEIIPDSRFIYVTFDDPIPERATQIVNSFSEVLAEKATDIVGVNNVQIVDYALVPIKPVSPVMARNVGLAVVLGIIVAFGIIFILSLMDNTIKTEEDVEAAINMHVVGVIPEFKGEVRKQ